MHARAVGPILRAFGALQLLQGLFMAVAPRAFYDAIGPFGTYNAHYVLDAATWALALGVVALIAAGRPAWRVPVLAFAALQFALHALNHVKDAGKADPVAVGVFDAVTLAALAVVLAAAVRAAQRSPSPARD